ncbi:MAG: hypothetical protein K6A44_02785 [bacterium]|nr:hypothetical protein [bacterium]
MENFDVEILEQVNLKETFKEILDDYVMFDETFNTNPVMYECFANYAFITKPDLKGKYLESYLIDLKQDVVEFFEEKADRSYNYQTLENLAFFRLNKISQQYDLAKNYIKDEEQLSKISNKAKEYKKDLDIIQALDY